LAVNVRDRSRLADVGIVAVQLFINAWLLGPHGGHGDVVSGVSLPCHRR